MADQHHTAPQPSNTSFTISQVTVADGPALAANNIPAFWADPHWRLEWRHRTLDYHVSQVALRYPRTLLRNRATARHQKAVDAATGDILGYARWSLPESHAIMIVESEGNGTPAWPEAVIPVVSEEEEEEINRVAATAAWDPDLTSDSLLDRMREIQEEIVARKVYMSTASFSSPFPFLPWRDRILTRERRARIPRRSPKPSAARGRYCPRPQRDATG